MPCRKRPVRKLWEHPKKLRTVSASRYEHNDPKVMNYWKNLIAELELSHSACKFWETTGDQVHNLVGDSVYERLRKIFNLPQEPIEYKMDKILSVASSTDYFRPRESSAAQLKGIRDSFSMTDLSSDSETTGNIEDTSWSTFTEQWVTNEDHHHTKTRSKSSASLSWKFSKVNGRERSFSDKQLPKPVSSKKSFKSISRLSVSSDTATKDDDLKVHAGDFKNRHSRRHRNLYYQMLYCNESETDMIKWNSNYKKKKYVTSATDEISAQAEIKTKEIAKDFFDFWTNIGSADSKSEIRKPEDIEALFQLWFKEHASQALVLDHKIIPCVLKSIASYVNENQCSCKKMLEKYVSWDIACESAPAKTIAFGAALPARMKHIPPKNNTDKVWNCVKIPEDLRSMACVWEDISHLTSTKSFQAWLKLHPKLPMPPVLQTGNKQNTHKKKSLFAPSDVTLLKEASSSDFGLTIPFSQVNIELKDVLAKLMNQ